MRYKFSHRPCNFCDDDSNVVVVERQATIMATHSLKIPTDLFVLLALLLLPFASSYSYNAPHDVLNLEGYGSWALLQAKMMEYDANQDTFVMKAPSVVGVYTPACQYLVDSAVFQGIHRLTGTGTAVASLLVSGGSPTCWTSAQRSSIMTKVRLLRGLDVQFRL